MQVQRGEPILVGTLLSTGISRGQLGTAHRLQLEIWRSHDEFEADKHWTDRVPNDSRGCGGRQNGIRLDPIVRWERVSWLEGQ